MPDSSAKKVWISPQVYESIHAWVQESLTLDPIPEVGGMLGGMRQESEGGWEIFLTHFLPARSVNFQSPVRIDFGSQIMLDWDRVCQENPGLQLAGWFHTHPGLTPYLSWTDLYTHQGFFGHPSQVAMVLDPLTSAWDLACFTWQRKGRMNNKPDLIRYFSWNSIPS